MVKSLLLVELCMYGHADFKGKSVRGGQTISEDDSGNEAALDAFSIFNGDVAAVYDALLVPFAARFYPRSAAEERGQALKVAVRSLEKLGTRLNRESHPDVHGAEELLLKRPRALILVAPKEAAGCEPEACVG